MRRDFHFKYENSMPEKKSRRNVRKPSHPAPPINAKRNPSAKAEEYSEYDEPPVVKTVKTEEPEVEINSEALVDEDVKVYTPKHFREETDEEKNVKREGNRFIFAAAIMAALGAAFIGVGIYIAATFAY